ncbi:MAG: hypothetical protein WCT04_06170 [Planctomycetota bacterium]
MRKQIIQQHPPVRSFDESNWLDIPTIAQVELSSEDESYPIEAALSAGGGAGWRAAEAGKQTIRIIFDEPQSIRKIHVEFRESSGVQRTQEFALSASIRAMPHPKEIVRQQYNFNADASVETENYAVNLDGVTALELVIIPDQNGGNAMASLARLRVA